MFISLIQTAGLATTHVSGIEQSEQSVPLTRTVVDEQLEQQTHVFSIAAA